MSRSAMARAITAASTKSMPKVGKRSPLLTSPTPCPERPIRWMAEEMERGDWMRTTLSSLPMSMPSSSELVATIAFSSPRLRRSSTASLISRDSEPWWE